MMKKYTHLTVQHGWCPKSINAYNQTDVHNIYTTNNLTGFYCNELICLQKFSPLNQKSDHNFWK